MEFIIIIMFVVIIVLGSRLSSANERAARMEQRVGIEFQELYDNKKQEYEYKEKALQRQFIDKQSQLNENFLNQKRIYDEKEKALNIASAQMSKRDKEIQMHESEKARLFYTNEETVQKNKILENLNKFNEEINEKKRLATEELEKIKKAIEEERKKQESINEEIKRRTEIEQNKDYYCIQINNDDRNDIEILEAAAERIIRKDFLRKAIYDLYIKNRVVDTCNRILGTAKVAGIYKITYMPTGECYVGRSTDVKGRWQDHIKASYIEERNTVFYSHMRKNGFWNYSFELIEKTNDLSPREKYWIDYYKPTLNEKSGG